MNTLYLSQNTFKNMIRDADTGKKKPDPHPGSITLCQQNFSSILWLFSIRKLFSFSITFGVIHTCTEGERWLERLLLYDNHLSTYVKYSYVINPLHQKIWNYKYSVSTRFRLELIEPSASEEFIFFNSGQEKRAGKGGKEKITWPKPIEKQRQG